MTKGNERWGKLMLQDRKIKVAYELFEDHEVPWNDEEIDKEMKKSMFNFLIPSIIWCHNNEELFDNPCKCKTFVETPLKKGYIRIKYACEENKYVPHNYTKQQIEDTLMFLAEHQNARSFIWCYGGEELFRNKITSKHIIRSKDLYKNTELPKPQITQDEKDLEERRKAYVEHDHPSTIENGTATILYIIVMVIGAIFKGRLLIWVMASFIYFRFINRRKIRQKRWDKMQEEKKNKKE